MCIFSQLLQSLCMIYNSHSHFFAKLVFILPCYGSHCVTSHVLIFFIFSHNYHKEACLEVWITLCFLACAHLFHFTPTILTITTLQDHCDPLVVHLVCHFFPTILTVKTYSRVDHFMFLDNSNNQNRIVFL